MILLLVTESKKLMLFFMHLFVSFKDARHQPFISPSEAVILESMMSGGTHLSLKAHFIAELPFITPLINTLTSINLSYNSFKV